ncbi:MAG: YggS family pyridoxal phosphate-dependent enzyme [Legionellales bacterium]|nr:YggS family pyridoxal phosphate-dependent enzyme [Legionellales bacterium]
MDKIQANINSIDQRIKNAEKAYHRAQGTVKLLAVTKSQSVHQLKTALNCGLTAFGENYLREALVKISALRGLGIEWHFIGEVQSNKTRYLAENFAWVQTVTHKKQAQRLNNQRPLNLPRLNICVQVHLGNDVNKGGVLLHEIEDLVADIQTFPRLHCRGLMAILPQCENFAEQYDLFLPLQEKFKALQHAFTLDTLSMGMSNDLEAAIAAGSTLVRIGQGIFGAR